MGWQRRNVCEKVVNCFKQCKSENGCRYEDVVSLLDKYKTHKTYFIKLYSFSDEYEISLNLRTKQLDVGSWKTSQLYIGFHLLFSLFSCIICSGLTLANQHNKTNLVESMSKFQVFQLTGTYFNKLNIRFLRRKLEKQFLSCKTEQT